MRSYQMNAGARQWKKIKPESFALVLL